MTTPPFLNPGEQAVLYDGVCKLCNGWVNFLLRHHVSHQVRFAAVQSEEGQKLLRFAGLPDQNIRAIVLINGEQRWLRAQAIFRVMRLLPSPWSWYAVLRFLPDFIINFAYDRIALNRYRLFGLYDTLFPIAADYPGRFLHPMPDKAQPLCRD